VNEVSQTGRMKIRKRIAKTAAGRSKEESPVERAQFQE